MQLNSFIPYCTIHPTSSLAPMPFEFDWTQHFFVSTSLLPIFSPHSLILPLFTQAFFLSFVLILQLPLSDLLFPFSHFSRCYFLSLFLIKISIALYSIGQTPFHCISFDVHLSFSLLFVSPSLCLPYTAQFSFCFPEWLTHGSLPLVFPRGGQTPVGVMCHLPERRTRQGVREEVREEEHDRKGNEPQKEAVLCIGGARARFLIHMYGQWETARQTGWPGICSAHLKSELLLICCVLLWKCIST